ncbi:DUF4446 family protein [Paenibacillus guangzhouensis]|uniref:DUF4446 family protein n=1 Tax=Paenibacillus guangzhouensis TaxID=1473112 RepID=UPI0012670A4F|nr:DUF4446 family protein [Paenibacillus guangzhouensis]
MDTMTLEQMQWMIMGVMVLLMVVLLIMFIAQAVKLKKLRRKYDLMMEGTGVNDLENIIIEMKEHIYALREEQSEHTKQVSGIHQQMKKMKSNVGFLRYNPFQGNGSDLSFSLAIVNDEQDGIVLSALHSRENTYVYAKPVEQGESKYPLSPEEMEALNLAQRKN